MFVHVLGEIEGWAALPLRQGKEGVLGVIRRSEGM